MKRHCELCERSIFIVVLSRRQHNGVQHLENHSLCSRCRQRLRDQICAERIGPKPWFSVRSTLRVMEQQTRRRVEVQVAQ